MRETTLKELLVENERDGESTVGLLVLFFLTIDQPAGLEVIGLEVSKPVPCLPCVCVLMCEPIDLHCACIVALCAGQSALTEEEWDGSRACKEKKTKRWEKR